MNEAPWPVYLYFLLSNQEFLANSLQRVQYQQVECHILFNQLGVSSIVVFLSSFGSSEIPEEIRGAMLAIRSRFEDLQKRFLVLHNVETISSEALEPRIRRVVMNFVEEIPVVQSS
jgi:hypothetical protein